MINATVAIYYWKKLIFFQFFSGMASLAFTPICNYVVIEKEKKKKVNMN